VFSFLNVNLFAWIGWCPWVELALKPFPSLNDEDGALRAGAGSGVLSEGKLYTGRAVRIIGGGKRWFTNRADAMSPKVLEVNMGPTKVQTNLRMKDILLEILSKLINRIGRAKNTVLHTLDRAFASVAEPAHIYQSLFNLYLTFAIHSGDHHDWSLILFPILYRREGPPKSPR